VHVTHDQEEAMAVADTVVVMNAGRIEDRGPPERVYLRPRTLFSAGFMGEVNMLPATVRDLSPETAGLDTDFGAFALPRTVVADAGVGHAVTLLIRPEHFREAGAVALGAARVEDVTFFGTHVRAHARLGPTRVVAHFPQGTTLAPGDEVRLSVDPARITALPGRPGP
jgi:spermidine/putrescine transport system ATP-binding protein